MFGFLDAPVAGAYHLVSALATTMDPVLGELSTAVAIVLFTACGRVLAASARQGRGARPLFTVMYRLFSSPAVAGCCGYCRTERC